MVAKKECPYISYSRIYLFRICCTSSLLRGPPRKRITSGSAYRAARSSKSESINGRNSKCSVSTIIRVSSRIVSSCTFSIRPSRGNGKKCHTSGKTQGREPLCFLQRERRCWRHLNRWRLSLFPMKREFRFDYFRVQCLQWRRGGNSKRKYVALLKFLNQPFASW